jgi:hypothetical protein
MGVLDTLMQPLIGLSKSLISKILTGEIASLIAVPAYYPVGIADQFDCAQRKWKITVMVISLSHWK